MPEGNPMSKIESDVLGDTLETPVIAKRSANDESRYDAAPSVVPDRIKDPFDEPYDGENIPKPDTIEYESFGALLASIEAEGNFDDFPPEFLEQVRTKAEEEKTAA